MPDFRTELHPAAMPAAAPAEWDGVVEPDVEAQAEVEPMSPEEQLFAARVALYGPELAAEVTDFYRSLVPSFKAKLGYIHDVDERNRRACELAEETAARMDMSRGQGYVQHPAHRPFRS